jgi:hypothetical protein
LKNIHSGASLLPPPPPGGRVFIWI